MKLVTLLAACSLAASEATYSAFTASLAQLGESGVTGEVTIFVTPTGLIGVGSSAGLEKGLVSEAAGGTDCTATNGCGVHVHSGTACTNSTTQGGHYFAGETDPWASLRYVQSDANGDAQYKFSLTDSATDIAGKPFVVHNNAGGRVACGILSEVPATASTLTSAVLAALDGGAVSGEVTILTTSTHMIGAGHVAGLEANLKAAGVGGPNCTAKNGCGVHVHSGTACTPAEDQGGHYFTGNGTDPWTAEQYQTTTAAGAGDFVFSVANAASNVVDKPFIIHNNAGGRVSCGLLMTAKEEAEEAKAGRQGGKKRGGSSGFSLKLWQWILLGALVVCCLGGIGMFMKKGAKRSTKKKKKSAPAAPAAPADVPEVVPEVSIPPLMPLATTATVLPSYTMVAPATTAYNTAYAAPMTMAAPVTTGPAMYQTAYAAPMTAGFAGTTTYAAPVSAGYPGTVV